MFKARQKIGSQDIYRMRLSSTSTISLSTSTTKSSQYSALWYLKNPILRYYLAFSYRFFGFGTPEIRQPAGIDRLV